MQPQKNYTGFVVSHTHWDRAWYWTFEQYRIRLVQTIDQIIEVVSSDPAFTSFTLDGQTVLLEDYLEIRPEQRTALERLIKDRRIFVGPWYVLPDEFLVSGEALIRNLMAGIKIASSFGHVMKEGYVPDPFGHVAQLPQILQGFGLRSFIFMRGMGAEIEELGSEFRWCAPDGTSVIAVYQRDNYGNLACWGFPYEFGDYRYATPDPKIALENLQKTFQSISHYATTPYLLFNNGIDHLPVQPQVPELIRYCNDNMKGLSLVQGSFPEFIDAVVQNGVEQFKSYKGELTGNHHHLILLSVYSTRMYLKVMNAACQNLLERYAEPIAGITALESQNDYTPFVLQAWKELLKNHPHDDICGCGIDEIHRDNVNRFEHVRQIGEYVQEHSLQDFSKNINTKAKDGKPILLYNPVSAQRTEVVRIEVLLKEDDALCSGFRVVNNNGEEIPFSIHSTDHLYRMEILTQAEYKRYWIDALVSLPSLGFSTLYLVPSRKKLLPVDTIKATARSIENSTLKLRIRSNGTMDLLDKRSGMQYSGLMHFEDCEDVGDEYTFSWSQQGQTFTSLRSRPKIQLLHSSPLAATIRITHVLNIPRSIDGKRKRRSNKKTPVTIAVDVSLRSTSSRVDLNIVVQNTALDHRLRVLFPSGIKSSTVHASEHFYVIERSVAHPKKPTFKNRFEYYSTQHQNEFVSLSDGDRGLTIANKGTPEFEIISTPDGNTIAITLLRSVGQLSRNDYITRHMQAGPQLQTPEAQCLGTYEYAFALFPHQGNWIEASMVQAVSMFCSPVRSWNVVPSAGKYPNELSIVKIDPEQLVVTAVKRSEDKSGLIVRFYNISGKNVSGTITMYREIQNADVVNLNEDFIRSIEEIEGQSCYIEVGAFRIVTIKFILK